MYRWMLAMLITASALWPQSFEVVSLKPSGPQSVRGSDGGPGTKDPGRYTFGQAAAMDLILVGYQVDPFQVSSKVALDQYRFDLLAILPQGATKEQFGSMVRNLLAERFHMKSHMESKEFPAYELVVANTGLKMKEAPQNPDERTRLNSTMSNGGDGTLVQMKAQQATMADLARYLHLPDRTRVSTRPA
jgi:uncharacterized protein (TIGR03435 family)